MSRGFKVIKGGGKMHPRTSALGARVGKTVRPGVEALLLAAVALGCAQAGWTIVTPNAANALSDANLDDAAPEPIALAQTYSPFTPHTVAGSTHAMAALLSSVQLNGVRMSLDPALSGAMFTLADGGQRAFLIGQEIADGVTLADVQAQYVIVAYEGGQRRLDMAAGPSFSFARAMMGLEPAPGAPQTLTADAAAPISEADRAWLLAAVRNVETANGVARGWRIDDAAPERVRAAGLAAGDLVTSINGARPGDIAGAIAATQTGVLRLEIERDGAPMALTLELGAPA